MNYKIKNVTTSNEMKEFLKLFDYWHKKGYIGFIPIFILHRYKDKKELYVLKNNNKIIGISLIIARKRPYEFYQIKTLAISPDYIGQGLGDYFLKNLIRPLHKNYDITTSVLTDNKRAIELYQNNGFQIYDTKTTKGGVETYEMVLPKSI